MAKERIQKVLALAGFGARRQCELLVLDGRVTINGHRVRELPVLVEPGTDRISVDGKPVHVAKPVYYILNKPKGVICTHNDPSGRKLAVELLSGVREKLFPVGRLDADSLGLLIMTNDGELAQKLTHPSFSVPKTYRVEVTGCPTPATLKVIRAGTWLSEGKTSPAEISFIHKQHDNAILEITLREGRNREIRRMLAKHGHRVRRLVRIRMGRLSIKGLSFGSYRKLRPEEVKYLQSLAAKVPDTKAEAPRPRRKPKPATRGGDTRGRSTGRTGEGAERSTRQGGGVGGSTSGRGTGRKTTRKPAAKSQPPRGTKGKQQTTPKKAAPKQPKKRRIILPE